MNNHENDNELQALLKQALPPVQNTELQRDLWPQMLRRLDDAHTHRLHIPWFDWVLAAGTVAALLIFPGAIPALLYHL